MSNLKEVRNRIVSVTSTQQITSAMKMVSAAKLRRAQDAITQMRPYAMKLQEILSNLTASLDSSEGGVFGEQRAPEKVLIIAITSNRGLAGAFNSNILKQVKVLLDERYKDQAAKGNVKFMAIGKKANDYFTKNLMPVHANHSNLYERLNFGNTASVAEAVMQAFASGEFDRVELVYNHFRNAAVQIPTVEQYLPVLPPDNNNKQQTSTDYIFEPDKESIVTELIPKSLKIQLYKAVLDSNAAEHGARMTAMSKATDNAKELIKELKLSYNKARQAAITNEILEIVGGAEALKG
ncbi:MAG: ATP synthase F1 subunit gamma [Flavobacteriales bacterium]